MNAMRKSLGTLAPKSSKKGEQEEINQKKNSGLTEKEELSPELVPIVTLLTSQANRRYYDGIFMLYYDLNGDGRPADREWREVYGILTGNQLAYWDAANLMEFKNNPEGLIEASSKPSYINFTDSTYNAMKTLPAAKKNLDNVIIVSTTLKNRYIIQLKSFKDLINWYSALRLSNYEYSSLQEAYTGALLSARGSRLSDIRTILAEKRFDHEDWVSIRYGSGMAWQRCYAVVEPSQAKKKSFTPGRLLFYESEQKKKKQLMAVVINAKTVTAVYPQSPLLIDHSTMLKLDASINYTTPSLSTKIPKSSRDDFKETSIFLMPEQHSSVPGFDTLVRFFIPLIDSFGLYGRPKRLKADRLDPQSLLFGLPTLPHVHYLELSDVSPLASRGDFFNWDDKEWMASLKDIMRVKLGQGYEGCGSAKGFGASSEVLSQISSNGSRIPTPPPKANAQYNNDSARVPSGQSKTLPSPLSSSTDLRDNKSRNVKNITIDTYNAQQPQGMAVGPGNNRPASDAHRFSQLAEIYHKYSTIKSPSDQFHTNRNQLLDGSAEDFAEDDLPHAIKQISLTDLNAGGMYPRNDDDLFSEDDDDDEVELPVRDESVHGSSNILAVPTQEKRNSSYSSVHSPLTQYHEFNEQFKNSVDQKHVIPSNDSVGSSKTTRMPYDGHSNYASALSFGGGGGGISKSKPSLNLSHDINSVQNGPSTPRESTRTGDHLSIHSESGKVTSGESSTYSNESMYDNRGDQPKQVSLNVLNNTNPNSDRDVYVQGGFRYQGKSKRISSPNNSQNHVPTFKNFDADDDRTGGAIPYNQGDVSIAPGPQKLTVGPSGGYQKQSQHQHQHQMQAAQQYQQAHSQSHHHHHRPPPPSQQHNNPVIQAPPQQQAYPQSSQFGYQTQPAPAPAPQTHSNQSMGRPSHSNRAPPGSRGQQMQPQMQYQMQPGYQQPRYQAQAGVPPSVTYHKLPSTAPVNSGIPPSVSTQSGFQHQRPMYAQQSSGFIPRQNNMPQSGGQGGQADPSGRLRAPVPQNVQNMGGQYQYQANTGVPPSVNVYGQVPNQNRSDGYQPSHVRRY